MSVELRNHDVWYTVYDAGTDEIVAYGRWPECARTMGMTRNTFQSTVSKTKRGTSKKYEIMVEDMETGEMETYGCPREPRPRLDPGRAAELYLTGHTDREIAEALAVSSAAVESWRRRRGYLSNGQRGRGRRNERA